MSDFYPQFIKKRIAVLLHDNLQDYSGKTGISLLRYSQTEIVAIIDRQSPGASLEKLTKIPRPIPIVASLNEAMSYNPEVLVIGIAPSGGQLPPAWFAEIKQAMASGLCLVNPLHLPLANHPELDLIHPHQWIWDLRQEPPGLPIGSAQARTLNCHRVLTVGTDMSIGKMSTCLELDNAAQKQGLNSQFLATGQTGLILRGSGLPLDAVRVDFAAGAVEKYVLEFGQNKDILFIEGQGSLLHPGSTATLPLLRGGQPTHLILVHKAGQTHVRKHPDVVIPPLSKVVLLYEIVASAAGALTPAKVVGIALNTYHLDDREAEIAIKQTAIETGLPCTDPVRFGGELLLNKIYEYSK